VASHVIHQHMLRQSTEPVFVDITDAVSELTVAPGEDPAVRTDNAQRVRHLARMLNQLPPRTAAALVLHRVAGYTVQEIADQLGVGRETVKRYLARGAQHCRDRRGSRAFSE
jgi:RNA polymerase sigma-19 factor, ECF subfamily